MCHLNLHSRLPHPHLLQHYSSNHMQTFSAVLGSITLWVINCLAGLTSSNLQKVSHRQYLKDLSIFFATVSPVLRCQRKCRVMGVWNSSVQLLRIFYHDGVFVTTLHCSKTPSQVNMQKLL